MIKTEIEKGRTAKDVIEQFRRDPENERLYRESEIRFGLSDHMAALRKKQKLSQEDLAKRVGCRQPFIAKLEGGAYDKCELSTLRTFARAMGYDISVDRMFYPIDSAFYSGKSSAHDWEALLALQDAFAKNIRTIALAKWSREECRSVGGASASAASEDTSSAA